MRFKKLFMSILKGSSLSENSTLDSINDGWVTTIKVPSRAPDFAYTEGFRAYRLWFNEMLCSTTENGWISFKIMRLIMLDKKVSNTRTPHHSMKEEVQKAFQDYLDKIIIGYEPTR